METDNTPGETPRNAKKGERHLDPQVAERTPPMPQGFGKKGTPAPNHPCTKGPNKVEVVNWDFNPQTMKMVRFTLVRVVCQNTLTADGHGYAELMQGTE